MFFNMTYYDKHTHSMIMWDILNIFDHAMSLFSGVDKENIKRPESDPQRHTVLTTIVPGESAMQPELRTLCWCPACWGICCSPAQTNPQQTLNKTKQISLLNKWKLTDAARLDCRYTVWAIPECIKTLEMQKSRWQCFNIVVQIS